VIRASAARKLTCCVLALFGIVAVSGHELRNDDIVGLPRSDLSTELVTICRKQFECNPGLTASRRGREVVLNASGHDQLNSFVDRPAAQGIRNLRSGETWCNTAVGRVSGEHGKKNVIGTVWRLAYPLFYCGRGSEYVADDMESNFYSHILGGGMATVCHAKAKRSAYLLVGDHQRSGDARLDTDPRALRGNKVRSVDLIADYRRDESEERDYSRGYEAPERALSPRYLLLLPACLMCLLGFVLLKKSIEDDRKPRIVMMLSGWLICTVGFGMIVFRVILNQI
jgi:hypothetical protein